jgi:hypothetical protein
LFFFWHKNLWGKGPQNNWQHITKTQTHLKRDRLYKIQELYEHIALSGALTVKDYAYNAYDAYEL